MKSKNNENNLNIKTHTNVVTRIPSVVKKKECLDFFTWLVIFLLL